MELISLIFSTIFEYVVEKYLKKKFVFHSRDEKISREYNSISSFVSYFYLNFLHKMSHISFGVVIFVIINDYEKMLSGNLRYATFECCMKLINLYVLSRAVNFVGMDFIRIDFASFIF